MTRDADPGTAFRNARSQFGEAPRIILTGKTGAGKSSLINALLGRDIARTGITPCTQSEQEAPYQGMTLIDMPGFAEADRHGQRLEFIYRTLPDVHLCLLVVGAPDRALEHERQFIADVRQVEPGMPFIVAGNKIDLLEPARDWDPAQLNLTAPRTRKEQNILAWSDEVRRACCSGPDMPLCLVAAGETHDAVQDQYGLDALVLQILSSLPEAVRNVSARMFQAEAVRKSRALKVIWGNAIAASAVGAIPVPLADVGILCAIQTEMILVIAMIYGIKMDLRQAAGLVGPALGFLIGPAAFRSLVKLLPGIGSVLAAGTAGAITLAIGWTYLEFFIHGNFKPSGDEVTEILKTQYARACHFKDQIEREARRKKEQSDDCVHAGTRHGS